MNLSSVSIQIKAVKLHFLVVLLVSYSKYSNFTIILCI